MSENGSVGCEGVGDTGTLRVEAALRHDIGSSVDPDPDEIRILPKRRGVRNITESILRFSRVIKGICSRPCSHYIFAEYKEGCLASKFSEEPQASQIM